MRKINYYFAKKWRNMQNNFFSALPAVYSEKPTVCHITPDNTKRLTPWSLKENMIVSFHYHNFVEIGYCFEGSGEHYTRDGFFPFRAGDALFIIPGHPHYTISPAGAEAKWMFLYFDLEELLELVFHQSGLSETASLNPELSLYDLIPRSRYPEICQLILRITKQYQTFLPGRNELLCSLFLELLLTLGREKGDKSGCPIRSSEDYGKLNIVIRHICNAINSGRIPELEELSPLCYMSTSNFRKVFRETVGIAPHDYIIQLAIQRTQKLLLSSDNSVLDICAEVGFHSVSSLNRNFMARCGMSPTAYRQMHQSLY